MLIGIFFGLFIVSLHLDNTHDNLLYVLVDFEDTTEKGDDQKSEKEHKEYRGEKCISNSSNGLYLSACFEFSQLDADHALEIFVEVVTPPPES